MQYEFKTEGDSAQMTIGGRLTFVEAPLFPKILRELEKAEKTVRLDIRLHDLQVIDSTGMSLFVHIYDASQKRGLAVTVHGASGMVASALQRAAFQTLFQFK